MNGYEKSDSVAVENQPSQETSATVSKKRPSNRVQIRNLPEGFIQESIEQLLSGCTSVKKSSLVNVESGPFINVIFETAEDAQKAVDMLNETGFEGASVHAELVNNNPSNGRSNRNGGGNGGNGRFKNAFQQGGGQGASRGTGYPLRILVSSEYVGAIIGRKGQTIRSITTRCKARVDVHGKENSGLIEKVISIFGVPENCTAACKEILLVMEQEASTNGRGEVTLKILADDRFCGRIIGKEGKMIKKIRDDTSTKITVSNNQEMAALFPDRVITVRGSVDGMSQAEAAISLKLAECMEHEVQQSQTSMAGVLMMPMGTNASYYPNNRPYDTGLNYYAPAAPMYSPYGGAGMMAPMSSPPHMGGGPSGDAVESCQIGVPNAAVGAIIGTAGANIKQIMRDSGAFINIESKKDGDPNIERLVCIKGSSDACWRASYMVFEKMKLEGFSGNEEVRLRTIIKIPKPIVGRIIGKSGKTVREIQHMSGALIKLPEEQSSQGEEVAVEIYGNFMATQTAQGRIRALASVTQPTGYSNGANNGAEQGMGRGGGNSRRSAPPADLTQQF